MLEKGELISNFIKNKLNDVLNVLSRDLSKNNKKFNAMYELTECVESATICSQLKMQLLKLAKLKIHRVLKKVKLLQGTVETLPAMP